MEEQQIDLGRFSSFAKPSCRKCYGRGYKLIQHPPIDYRLGQPQMLVDYCDCVKNRYTKAMQKQQQPPR